MLFYHILFDKFYAFCYIIYISIVLIFNNKGFYMKKFLKDNIVSDELELALAQKCLQQLAKKNDLKTVIDAAITLADDYAVYPHGSVGEFLKTNHIHALVEDFNGLQFFIDNKGEDVLTEERDTHSISELIPAAFNDVDYLKHPAHEGHEVIKTFIIGALADDFCDFEETKEFTTDSLHWQYVRPYTQEEIDVITDYGKNLHNVLKYREYKTLANGEKIGPVNVEKKSLRIPEDGLHRTLAQLNAKVRIVRDKNSSFDVDYVCRESGVNKKATFNFFYATVIFNTNDWTHVEPITEDALFH